MMFLLDEIMFFCLQDMLRVGLTLLFIFFAAFGVFCGGSTAPLTGPVYVLQPLQRVERSRMDGHVSSADSVWTEDFFDVDFGSKSVSSPCGLGLRYLYYEKILQPNVSI